MTVIARVKFIPNCLLTRENVLDCKGLTRARTCSLPLKRQPRYSTKQKFISLHLSFFWIAEFCWRNILDRIVHWYIHFKKARHGGNDPFLFTSVWRKKKNEPIDFFFFFDVLPERCFHAKCHLKRMSNTTVATRCIFDTLKSNRTVLSDRLLVGNFCRSD